MIVESLLLLAGTVLLVNEQQLGARYFCCMAMGLQNGLATYYTSAVIRLTHMTGIVSDIGMVMKSLLLLLSRTSCLGA